MSVYTSMAIRKRKQYSEILGTFPFSIFGLDDSYTKQHSPLAHACRRDGRLLGHELREHESPAEPRIQRSADFHDAFRGHVPAVARGIAQAVPQQELETRTNPVHLWHHGLHALLLDRKYGTFTGAIQ